MLNEQRNVPTRYIEAEFDQVSQTIKECVDGMIENPLLNKGFYLFGKPGTGKTYTAWAVLKYIKSLENPIIDVLLIKSSRIVECIKNTFQGLNEYSDEYFAELEEISDFEGILIIDDIGAEKYPEGVIVKYFEILDKRYEKMLPTSFTSNVNLAELRERIGERIVSRISETCYQIQLEKKNMRN